MQVLAPIRSATVIGELTTGFRCPNSGWPIRRECQPASTNRRSVRLFLGPR